MKTIESRPSFTTEVVDEARHNIDAALKTAGAKIEEEVKHVAKDAQDILKKRGLKLSDEIVIDSHSCSGDVAEIREDVVLLVSSGLLMSRGVDHKHIDSDMDPHSGFSSEPHEKTVWNRALPSSAWTKYGGKAVNALTKAVQSGEQSSN